ncbi:MAG: ATP-binding protein [Planctomycetota bacterium]
MHPSVHEIEEQLTRTRGVDRVSLLAALAVRLRSLDLARARRLAAEACELAEEQVDFVLLGQAKTARALVRRRDLEFDGALSDARGALELLQQAPTRTYSALAHAAMGEVRYQRSEMSAACESFDRGLELLSAEERRGSFAGAELANNLGRARYARGEYAGALSSFREAIRIAGVLEDPVLEGFCRTNVANVLFQLGETGRALSAFREALRIQRRERHLASLAHTLNNLAMAHLRLGDNDEALSLATESLGCAPESESTGLGFQALLVMSSAHLAEGDGGEATSLATRARERASRMSNLRHEALALQHLGQVLLATGELDRALKAHTEALARIELPGSELEVSCTRGIARIHLARDDPRAALESVLPVVSRARGEANLSVLERLLPLVVEAYELLERYAEALSAHRELRETERRLFGAATESRIEALRVLRDDDVGEPRREPSDVDDAPVRTVGGVAQDVGNLVTVIESYGRLLEQRQPAAESAHVPLERMIAATERAAHLTEQLVAFSRKRPTRPDQVHVAELLKRFEGLAGGAIVGDDLRAEVEVRGPLPPVDAEAGQLAEVLANLVRNARDAMPDGEAVRIVAEAIALEGDPSLAPGNYLRVRVRDQGRGMDDATLARAFEPFFTTKEERRKGAGLGLSTARGIVRQCGGDLRARSTPGEGSTFDVYLPASPERPVAVAAADSQDAPAPRRCTILVVEDEGALRELECATLVDAGYEAIAAADGEEAIEHARSGRQVDLVVSDIAMPRMRGPELLRAMREERSEARFLFTSGHPELGSADAFLLQEFAGEFEYLPKPFRMTDLRQRVDALVGRDG